MNEVQKTSIRGGQRAFSLDRLTRATASSRGRDRSTSMDQLQPDDTGLTSRATTKTNSRTTKSSVRSSYPPASHNNKINNNNSSIPVSSRTLRSNSRESMNIKSDGGESSPGPIQGTHSY